MKIVNNKLSYKTKDKAKGNNLLEGEKVLGTNIIENISFRKGTNALKKRQAQSLDLLESYPIRIINNSVTVE
jgi:hypothetical protein